MAEFLRKGDLRENKVDFPIVASEALGSVLEAGSAFGMFSRYLAPEQGYVGVDLSKLAVQEARTRHPQRLFVWGDALRLGEGWYKSVDTVVALQFIEHFPDARATLMQLRSLARERIVLTVPRGLPAPGDDHTVGHLIGWRTVGELAELFENATRLRMHPLEVSDDHIGAVLTW